MTSTLAPSLSAPARRNRGAAALAAAALTLGAVAVQNVALTPVASATMQVQGVRLNAYEAKLVALVNDARAAHGLRRLSVTPGATDVARRWAKEQAASNRMSHNPSFSKQLSAAGGSSWRWAAENVGFGYADDPDGLFKLYMNSPLHRANILSTRARYIGMGVVLRQADGWTMAYNTMNFNDAYSSAYGPTRVPAAALPLDGGAITQTRYLASFEHGHDQRVATAATNDGDVSVPVTDRPRSGDNAVRWTVGPGAASGHADLLLHQPMDLTRTRQLELRLAADGSRGSVPVSVVLLREGHSPVTLGTAAVTGTKSAFTFDVPEAARSFRDTLVLRVDADHSARLALFAVRAVV